MTVVFGHANAEDLGMVNTWMYYLMQTLEINTVAYDYPGYGVSTGKPSEKGVLAAAEVSGFFPASTPRVFLDNHLLFFIFLVF